LAGHFGKQSTTWSRRSHLWLTRPRRTEADIRALLPSETLPRVTHNSQVLSPNEEMKKTPLSLQQGKEIGIPTGWTLKAIVFSEKMTNSVIPVTYTT
jgi:hypothetical protein